MRIENKVYRTIWFENNLVKIIDQTKLPHQFVIKDLKTVKETINAGIRKGIMPSAVEEESFVEKKETK